MSDGTVAWTPGEGDPLLDGRYRLGDRIGGGAVAEVYRAVDERLARPVAVKLFRGDAAEQLQRHEAEMRTLASLDHPNLVTVYDAGTDEQSERPYLVMQLVEGVTLADELRDGPLAADRVARYGAALADALAYVHAQGFVHRDVKPANVLIAEDGRVHLADFGIARLVDSAHVTRTGEVLGTPAYFAPEQVNGEAVGPSADVYALGVMLLECLTGRRPFEGTAMEVAMARLTRDPDVTSVPPSWQDLLRAMTSRATEARPSAGQVAEALRALAEGRDIDHTVVLPPVPVPSATTVMPATAVAGAAPFPPTAAYPVTPSPAPAAQRRRGPAALVVLLVAAIVAAVVVGIVVATHQNTGTTTSFTPGTPRLHQPLEDDMQQIERLVRR